MHPSLRSPLVLSLAWLAACGGKDDDTTDTDDTGYVDADQYDVLVDTVLLPRGDATCPAGGVTLRTGYDNGQEGGTKDDGILQDGEVDASTTICNGQSGTVGEPGGTLFRYEPVEPGEGGCDDGGVSIFVGTDASNDGELQENEVSNTTIVCADEDPFNVIPGPDAPGTPAGAATIDLSGGQGGATGGRGGSGGFMASYLFQPGNSFLRGHTTGEVDADFSVPAINPSFGQEKLTVTSDKVVMFGSTGSISTTYPDGQLFLSDNTLYEHTTANGNRRITGLEIASGATLTLDGDTINSASVAIIIPVGGGTTTFSLNFDDGVDIKGTLDIDDAWLGSTIYLYGDIINVSGTIDASAPQGQATVGLYAYNTSIFGTVAVTGTVDVSAKGTNADGEGGNIYIEASRNVFVDGTLKADAASQVGEGHNGGYITTRTYGGPAQIAGTLSLNASDGQGDGFYEVSDGEGGVFTYRDGTGNGGEGGHVYVEAGKVVFNATVNANGGDGSTSCNTGYYCQGGEGGSVNLYASEFGGIAAAGTWTLDGGDGEEFGQGGDGGEGTLEIRSGSSGIGIVRSAGADMSLGASVSATGGESEKGEGGEGGQVYLAAQYLTNPTAELQILGVTDINVSAGDGGEGGHAGRLYNYYAAYSTSGSIFQNVTQTVSSLDEVFPTGITFDIPVSANGGKALIDNDGAGGAGGYVYSFCETSPDIRRDIWFTADVELNGATGDGLGGEGGSFIAQTAFGDISVEGTVSANGASALNTTDYGRGGWGGEGALFTGGGTIDADLVFTANGGDALYQGGEGGRFAAEGALVEWAGSCTMDGGDATSTDGDGGDGGEGGIASSAGTTNATGTVSVDGGAGGSSGDDGDDGLFGVDGLPY